MVDKLTFKHQVETDEVEEALGGSPKFRFVEKGERKDEDVYLLWDKLRQESTCPCSSFSLSHKHNR